MIRRPPRSTRTDTLFPYTTLFRSRNAMVAELGEPAETAWRPDAVPPDYRWESREVPDYFAEVVARILPPEARQEPALTTALRLARHLRETSRQGAPIQSNTRETYRSEEHKSELQSLMRISYAAFCV